MKKLIIYLLLFFFTPNLSYTGESLSDITIDENNLTNKLIASVVRNIYIETQNSFNSEVESFTKTIQSLITNLGEYDEQVAETFDTNCQLELVQSTNRINNLSKNALKNYYNQLQQLNISYGLGVTDPVAQKLEIDINSIQFDMISEMRSALIILQSVDELPSIGQQIKEGINLYQQTANKEYAEKQAAASQERKSSWWKDLKATGNEFLGDFKVNLEKECKIAIADAVGDAINEIGQQASNQISTYVGDVTSSAIDFGTDLIGKQLTSIFQKYSTTQINDMLNRFPDYLKNEAFKTIGIDPDEDVMLAGFKATIRQKYPVTNNFDNLQVRQSTELSPAEINFVRNRMPKITDALRTNFEVNTPLKIALCASGGGNRAMLVTLGFYLGAQDTGLFDSLLYTAGVSGSTWTISSWSYLNSTLGMSLADFKDQLIHGPMNKSMISAAGMSTPPTLTKEQQNIVATNSAKHFAYDQTISAIDLYSGFIGNYTLLPAGKNRLDVTWSSIADTIEQGNIPLPMGAAVSYKGSQPSDSTEYYWFEAGPFEVGSDQIGSYVPTWAFGSKFAQGKPVTGYQGHAPEYPISYFQGVYGSAFAVSVNEIVDQGLTNPTFKMLGQNITVPVDAWIKTSLSEVARDRRIFPATFNNYTAGLPTSPISTASDIRLYDGAMNYNFPLPLAMRPSRDVDVIFICDAAVDSASLKFAQRHAQRNGLKFPDMSKYTDDILRLKPLTVFNDPRNTDYDKDMITMLYCPFIKNDGFSNSFDPEICMTQECNTFNFKYQPEQAQQVIGLMRYNVNQIKDEIKTVLQALEKQRMPQIVETHTTR